MPLQLVVVCYWLLSRGCRCHIIAIVLMFLLLVCSLWRFIVLWPYSVLTGEGFVLSFLWLCSLVVGRSLILLCVGKRFSSRVCSQFSPSFINLRSLCYPDLLCYIMSPNRFLSVIISNTVCWKLLDFTICIKWLYWSGYVFLVRNRQRTLEIWIMAK